jgi:cytochrome c peroxidase
VLGPLVAANEMGNPSLGYVVAVVASLPDYAGLFEKAFDEPANVTTIGRAIAAWERTLLAGDSPFDRWRFGGDEGAIKDPAKRGFALFEGKAGCTACHVVEDDHALFTDHGFHATGIGYRNAYAPSPDDLVRIQLAPGSFTTVKRRDLGPISEPIAPDGGRYEVTLDPQDRWKYKTPSLRNVALTAPYMHDGSLLTLRDVVDFYNRGGVPHPGLDPAIQPLGLSDSEVDDIVAFLESLTAGNIADLIADARSVKVGNVGE